ncbi:protein rep [Nocardia gipuzkoensis]|uniref:protein rep n=1 Tax=Nocardia gipuzkoensis TaxID=2749991 RepID=UPI0015EEAC1C|nr:protein rep [Nocardia gipuzkoensis]
MVADAHDSATDDKPSCVACGMELPAQKMGRPRRYCNRACAKNARAGLSSPTQASIQAASPADHPGPEAGGVVAAGQGLPENDALELAEDTSADFRTWYYANFASPAGQDLISTRRKLRYRLRHLLREVTSVDRCKGCGWEPIANGIVIKASTTDGRTTAGFGGLETCGRVWLCPVCSAKIRVRRGDQIAEAVGRHLDGGGTAWFVTVTLPHEKGDALADSFAALTEAWRYVKTGRAYQRDRKDFGILGDIKAVEVTHGENGWHPHAHVLVIASRGLEFDEMCAWVARLDARWAKGLAKVGWPTGKPGVRLTVVPVEKGKGLAAYITKVQEKGLGNELARADMKDAREGEPVQQWLIPLLEEFSAAETISKRAVHLLSAYALRTGVTTQTEIARATDVTVSAAANRAASRLARETWAEVWPEKS